MVVRPSMKVTPAPAGAGMGPHRICTQRHAGSTQVAHTRQNTHARTHEKICTRWRRHACAGCYKRTSTLIINTGAHWRAHFLIPTQIHTHTRHTTHQEKAAHLAGIRFESRGVPPEQGRHGHRLQLAVAHRGPDAVQPPGRGRGQGQGVILSTRLRPSPQAYERWLVDRGHVNAVPLNCSA